MKDFAEGALVWARIAGLPYWPGQVLGPDSKLAQNPKIQKRRTNKPGIVLVSFFGDSTYNWLDRGCLEPFEKFYDRREHQVVRQKHLQETYIVAVQEAKELWDRREGREPVTDHEPIDFLSPETWPFIDGPVPAPPPPDADDLELVNAKGTLSWLRRVAANPLSCPKTLLPETLAAQRFLCSAYWRPKEEPPVVKAKPAPKQQTDGEKKASRSRSQAKKEPAAHSSKKADAAAEDASENPPVEKPSSKKRKLVVSEAEEKVVDGGDADATPTPLSAPPVKRSRGRPRKNKEAKLEDGADVSTAAANGGPHEPATATPKDKETAAEEETAKENDATAEKDEAKEKDTPAEKETSTEKDTPAASKAKKSTPKEKKNTPKENKKPPKEKKEASKDMKALNDNDTPQEARKERKGRKKAVKKGGQEAGETAQKTPGTAGKDPATPADAVAVDPRSAAGGGAGEPLDAATAGGSKAAQRTAASTSGSEQQGGAHELLHPLTVEMETIVKTVKAAGRNPRLHMKQRRATNTTLEGEAASLLFRELKCSESLWNRSQLFGRPTERALIRCGALPRPPPQTEPEPVVVVPDKDEHEVVEPSKKLKVDKSTKKKTTTKDATYEEGEDGGDEAGGSSSGDDDDAQEAPGRGRAVVRAPSKTEKVEILVKDYARKVGTREQFEANLQRYYGENNQQMIMSILHGEALDLYTIFKEVAERGGYDAVEKTYGGWRHVALAWRPALAEKSNVRQQLSTQYRKLLLKFEGYLSANMPLIPMEIRPAITRSQGQDFKSSTLSPHSFHKRKSPTEEDEEQNEDGGKSQKRARTSDAGPANEGGDGSNAKLRDGTTSNAGPNSSHARGSAGGPSSARSGLQRIMLKFPSGIGLPSKSQIQLWTKDFGEVNTDNIVTDRNKGAVTITFNSPEEAAQAEEQLGLQVDGALNLPHHTVKVSRHRGTLSTRGSKKRTQPVADAAPRQQDDGRSFDPRSRPTPAGYADKEPQTHAPRQDERRLDNTGGPHDEGWTHNNRPQNDRGPGRFDDVPRGHEYGARWGPDGGRARYDPRGPFRQDEGPRRPAGGRQYDGGPQHSTQHMNGRRGSMDNGMAPPMATALHGGGPPQDPRRQPQLQGPMQQQLQPPPPPQLQPQLQSQLQQLQAQLQPQLQAQLQPQMQAQLQPQLQPQMQQQQQQQQQPPQQLQQQGRSAPTAGPAPGAMFYTGAMGGPQTLLMAQQPGPTFAPSNVIITNLTPHPHQLSGQGPQGPHRPVLVTYPQPHQAVVQQPAPGPMGQGQHQYPGPPQLVQPGHPHLMQPAQQPHGFTIVQHTQQQQQQQQQQLQQQPGPAAHRFNPMPPQQPPPSMGIHHNQGPTPSMVHPQYTAPPPSSVPNEQVFDKAAIERLLQQVAGSSQGQAPASSPPPPAISLPAITTRADWSPSRHAQPYSPRKAQVDTSREASTGGEYSPTAGRRSSPTSHQDGSNPQLTQLLALLGGLNSLSGLVKPSM